MRPVTKILCVICLFILLAACNKSKSSGTNNLDQKSQAEENCINKIIAIDDSLGKIRNDACNRISLSSTITQYVKSLKEKNYKDCPASFTTAFHNHLQTWSNILEITDHYPDLRGEMHAIFSTLEKSEHSDRFKILLNEIWETWSLVEEEMKYNTHEN